MAKDLESQVAELFHRGEGVFTGKGLAYRDPRVFPQDNGGMEAYRFDAVVDGDNTDIFANAIPVSRVNTPQIDGVTSIHLQYQTSPSGEMSDFSLESTVAEQKDEPAAAPEPAPSPAPRQSRPVRRSRDPVPKHPAAIKPVRGVSYPLDLTTYDTSVGKIVVRDGQRIFSYEGREIGLLHNETETVARAGMYNAFDKSDFSKIRSWLNSKTNWTKINTPVPGKKRPHCLADIVNRARKALVVEGGFSIASAKVSRKGGSGSTVSQVPAGMIDLTNYQPANGNTYTAVDGRRIFEHQGAWTELVPDSDSLVGRALMYNHLPKSLIPRSQQWLYKGTNFHQVGKQVEGERWPHAAVSVVNAARMALIVERDGISMAGPAPQVYQRSAAPPKNAEVQPIELERIELAHYDKSAKGEYKRGNPGEDPRYVQERGVVIPLFNPDNRVAVSFLVSQRLAKEWSGSAPNIREALEQTDLVDYLDGQQGIMSGNIANMAIMYCIDQGYLRT